MNKAFKLLSKNIRDECFKDTIDICFKYATFFSLTTNFDSIKNCYSEKLVDNLKYCLLKTFKTEHWHCYYILDKNKPLSISIYRANEKAKQIILNTCDNIYLEIDDSTFIAEDICFFSDAKLFLGTVSHAGICNIYPSSDSMLNLFLNLKSICWEEVDYLNDEFIELNL